MQSRPQLLDEEYLGFCDRTAGIFAKWPELEALRRFVFKEILIGRRQGNWATPVKRLLRPVMRGGRTANYCDGVDVVVWVDSWREVVLEQLVPVVEELVRRGVRTLVVSQEGGEHFPGQVLAFESRASLKLPRWAVAGWSALCELDPQLWRGKELFYEQASCTDGLIHEFNRLLTSIKPKLVLTAASNDQSGAAITMSANSLGIKTAVIQHGIPEPFYTPILAKKFLAWGPSSQARLEGLGIPSNEIAVLGSPRHDRISSRIGDGNSVSLTKALELPPRPTFVFFSNGNDLVRNGVAPTECASWLESAASHLKDRVNIVVRLHPNEDGTIYAGRSNLIVSKGKPSLDDTLGGCVALGSLCSTVMLEGLLYRKPVWQFYRDGWPVLADNWKTGLAQRISSADELVNQLELLVRGEMDGAGRNETYRRAFANHPKATGAVCDWIQRELTPVGRQGE